MKVTEGRRVSIMRGRHITRIILLLDKLCNMIRYIVGE